MFEGHTDNRTDGGFENPKSSKLTKHLAPIQGTKFLIMHQRQNVWLGLMLVILNLIMGLINFQDCDGLQMTKIIPV